MKRIELTQGKLALVDDEDYDQISKLSWYYNQGYARSDKMIARKRTRTYMHRLIINVPAGMFIDHIDSDRLNNQKSNLRIVTQQQNNYHIGHRACIKTSIYKGVYLHKKSGSYHARIRKDNKVFSLGFFKKQEDAAAAYNNAALQLHGEFAILNHINI